MNMRNRFIAFAKKENTRNFVALVYYLVLVAAFIDFNIPLILKIIEFFIIIFISSTFMGIYEWEYLNQLFARTKANVKESIIQEIKKIVKEIIMSIPIIIVSIIATSIVRLFILDNGPENQISIEQDFKIHPVIVIISTIVIAPIIEEITFRFLPRRFIKNKALYIIISSVIFSSMHVIGDPNAFYYIWLYMIDPLYWSYRYCRTDDILVTISLHSFSNLIAMLFVIF